jgi:hypothetical protein
MIHQLEELIASVWNRLVLGRESRGKSDLELGYKIRDGQVSKIPAAIPELRRTEHIAVLGKTGTGKSSLLKHFVLQDIKSDRGFVFFDLHGDAQGFVLRAIAEEEKRRGFDLSERLIVIEPADPTYSVGLNVLEDKNGQQENFVQISEIAQILKQRWHLDAFGARTEELLRNALYVLSENRLTFLELALLLTSASFRAASLERVGNPDVRSYFETRYDPLSESMQTSFREAVLNKTTAFTTDPHFRHILGQPQSTFSLVEAMDNAQWIVINLNKGRLGEQAMTLGSLFLSKLKNAIFARRSRKLFTLYCDELQNLTSFDSGVDALFSEARKFGICLCSANQFLDQYPLQMKAAILSVGTLLLFQLSSDDASKMASALGGGRQLGEILRYLRHQEIVVKTGHSRWFQVSVPKLRTPEAEAQSLYHRCRIRWAKPRPQIERDICARSAVAVEAREELDDWD